MSRLDTIWSWYIAGIDSLRLVQRMQRNRESFPRLTERGFESIYERSPIEVEQALDEAQVWVENLVVLHLVAVFERILRRQISAEIDAARRLDRPVQNIVLKVCRGESEYWRLGGEVLDVFPSVDANLRGQVKQIVQFRDWIAHGRHVDEDPPIAVTPHFAKETLAKFLHQANLAHQ